jgi:hypothetical protein
MISPFQLALASSLFSITPETQSAYATLESYADEHGLDESQCVYLLSMWIEATEDSAGERLSVDQVIKNFERRQQRMAIR